jgi:hypothetical protein
MKTFTAKWLLIIVVSILLLFNGILLYKNHMSKQSCREILIQLNMIKNNTEKQTPLTFLCCKDTTKSRRLQIQKYDSGSTNDFF